MHKCAAESSTKPQRAEGLRARVTPTQNPSELLLSWSDVEERRVKTYKVDFSRDATAASRSRVNQCDYHSYRISPRAGVAGSAVGVLSRACSRLLWHLWGLQRYGVC